VLGALAPPAPVLALCLGLTCPANITMSNQLNQCGGVVNYPAPTPSESGIPGCGAIVCAPPSGSFFPVGSTSVQCASTSGPTCSFLITVVDTQPPSMVPNANQEAVPAEPGMPAVVDVPPPLVSDNCPGVMAPNCSLASGSSFASGSTTVSCTSPDAAGNTVTSAFGVRVFDACVQDDAAGDFLRWSSADGVYQLEICGESACGAGGLTRAGTGEVAPTPVGFVLRHEEDGAALRGTVNFNKGTGKTLLKVIAGTTKLSWKHKDPALLGNTCVCPP
jgi:hypothetical protein